MRRRGSGCLKMMICEDPVRLMDEYGQEVCKREHLKMLVSEHDGERTRNSG